MGGDCGRGPRPPEPPAGAPRAAGAAAVPGAGSPVLDQVFDSGSLYALRAAVAAHAAQAGLTGPRVYDVVIAAHELAANAVRHGAGQGRLRLWADGPMLHCQVSDDGAANAAGDEDAGSPDTAPWRSRHGHGLWVIEQVADQVTLHHGPGGSTATVSFTIGSPGQPPEPRPPGEAARSSP